MSRNAEDIRRFPFVRFFRVQRRPFATREPSERRYIGIDIQGRPGNGGEEALECGGEIC